MPIEKRREKVYYVTVCGDCGKEFEVSEDSTKKICYKCKTNRAIEQAKKELSTFVGARIINIEPTNCGHLTGQDQIETIEIETTDGKRITLHAAGYDDDRYMKWEPTESWE